MRASPQAASAPKEAIVVTKAANRAADRLGIKNGPLAKTLGLSAPTISRMRNGEYFLQPDQKPFELAVLFVRLYRSLDAVVDGDDNVASSWITNSNTALGGTPLKLIQTVAGLTDVIQYLDARRAIV